MMSLSRMFGLMLLFFFFEAVVAVVATFAYPERNVFVACTAMTTLALAVWAVFALVTRVLTRPRVPQVAPAPKPLTLPAGRLHDVLGIREVSYTRGTTALALKEDRLL